MQLLFRYAFLKWQDVPLSLADWQYVFLVLSTVLIAAGGYVINDIFDQDTDADNKPGKTIVGSKISESAAYNIYVALNITGVGIGFYLSNVIMRPGFATIFILIAALLYLYATSLKQTLLIGNIIVAVLLSFSVIIIGIFDLFPATYEGNQKQMGVLFSILIDYAIYAFIIFGIFTFDADRNGSEIDFLVFAESLQRIKRCFSVVVIQCSNRDTSRCMCYKFIAKWKLPRNFGNCIVGNRYDIQICFEQLVVI
jgi:hypothetical protein